MRHTVTAIFVALFIAGTSMDAQIMEVHSKSAGKQTFNLSNVDSITFIPGYSYFESFDTVAAGWAKIAGPGTMQVVNGVFKHTSVGYSVWCEYAFSSTPFGHGTYEVDVFVDSNVVSTTFAWRVPTLTQQTGSGGNYQARFNNSTLAPGTAGHFILEKFDPAGRVILLDIPKSFYGLNHLSIADQGTSLTLSINGVNYGPVDVSGYTAVSAGYIFFGGGDRGGGDYFDNMVVR